MTISTEDRRAGPFEGNDVTTSFPFTFKVFDEEDLLVAHADAEGVETVLTLDTHYSVTLNADQDDNPGGSITYPLSGDPLPEGETLTAIGDLAYTQNTDIQNAGGFNADVIETALDRCVILLQQLAEKVGRTLQLAISTVDGFNPSLPVPVAGELIGWDSDGLAMANYAINDTPGIAASDLSNTATVTKGDAMVGEKRTAAGAVATTVHESNERRKFDVSRDFDVTASSSAAEVKAALQLAITAAGALTNGGTVEVPGFLRYGYQVDDRSTWPSFAGITKPVLVIDYSAGDSYAGYPTGYDGCQVRYWGHTPQTTSPGQHDGNTHWLRGAWAPAFVISNDMDLSGARAATDNRRANTFYGVNGVIGWRLGQGTLDSNTATDEELSNFGMEKFSVPGDTIGAYTPFLIERATGNWSFGGATNAPPASYHFKSITAGYVQGMFESLTTTAIVSLRNSNGSGDDVHVKNVSGDLALNIPALGDALVVKKATRNVLIGAGADDAAAILNVASTTKGFLPPKMTTAQRDAIASPPAGLMIYNTTTNKLNVRVAAAWEAITSA